MTIVGAYTCVAYKRNVVNDSDGGDNDLAEGRDEHGQPLTPRTPIYPLLPTPPSPARVS
jgi:hypothetical protein